MPAHKRSPRFIRPVRRETAERYVLLTLLSFAASVSLTRLGLSLTGYPQLGGGELHIAHVLWGGLLLFAAALLPLVLANRWVFTAGSVLAGVGVGLFIDEVGKFITQRNDYFFRRRAIVYTFFLLTILLLSTSAPDDSPHAELHRCALGDIREMLEEPITPAAIRNSVCDSIGCRHPPNPGHVDPRQVPIRFLENEQRGAAQPAKEHPADTALSVFSASASGPHPPPCALLALALAGGLLTLRIPCTPWGPGYLRMSELLSLYAGGKSTRFCAELVRGTCRSRNWVGHALRARGRPCRSRTQKWEPPPRSACLSLTTVDLLLFYFEQFSTVITATIQFILLIGLLFWRRSAASS
jgi:hypothetical protein